MKTYPLESISLEEAIKKQFRFVDCITHHLSGYESLSRGDLGVIQPLNQPITTNKVESIISEFFNAEDAILVRGAGTGAIRYGLSSIFKSNQKILIHDAPVYSTTNTSFEMLGLIPVRTDYNDLNLIKKTLIENDDIVGALIQYSRQQIEDNYDIEEVIKCIKSVKDIPILTDDNYVVMKVNKIGVEAGADLSCFSTFKLQGPEGIGCVVGKKTFIDKIRKMHYSGGCQTQGFEAMEVIRGLASAPVMLAISAMTTNEIFERLNNNEINGIKNCYIANAQSKVILVEFEKPIAKKVLENAEKFGALPSPVGSESKYEIVPLFYRISNTFLRENPSLKDYMIRINPNRASANTIINILKNSMENV